MADFIIIGLSSFGSVLAYTLSSLGENVLVVDEDKEKVQEIKDFGGQSVIADASDKKILERLVANQEVTAVICMGERIEKTVMVTYYLHQLGLKRIIAKTHTEDHGKVLRALGATEIVYPEKDMAVRMAEKLHSPNTLERLSLGQDYTIVELLAPNSFVQKSLIELQLRNKYKINVLAIKNGNDEKSIIVPPDAGYVLKELDTLVVLGHHKDIERLASISE